MVINFVCVQINGTSSSEMLTRTRRKTKIKLQMLLISAGVKVDTKLELNLSGSLQFTVCPLGRPAGDRHKHGRVRCDLLQGRA